MATEIARRRFTVQTYEQMIAAGILTEDDRVELIAGEIIDMSPIGIRHMNCLNQAAKRVGRAAGNEWLVSIQNPIRLAPDSQPQPDLALVPDCGENAPMPAAGEVRLVIEVADSSRNYDRQVKLPLYAAAGIPEAWLCDLVAETIERHTAPEAGRYTLIAIAARGQELTSTVLPALILPANLIPRADL